MTETLYSVGIETEAVEVSPSVAEALERLADVVAAKDGMIEGASTSWGGLAGGPGVRFSLRAPDPVVALETCLQAFRKALVEANIPEPQIARVDVMTEAYLDRWLEEEPEEYLGVAEVAELLNISKQRAHELRQRAHFPKPIAQLAAGPVWTRTSLNHFIAGWERRPGRPATEDKVLGHLELVRRMSDLTDRERQILDLLTQGLRAQEIATRLDISPAAVKTHLQNVLEKLGVEAKLRELANEEAHQDS